MFDQDYCNSAYLTFRWIPKDNMFWSKEWRPSYPKLKGDAQTPVKDTREIKEFISHYLNNHFDKYTGILLSGGIDSAILASYLPPETNAYTIKFIADNAVDESENARKYADKYHLNLHIVDVTWDDYEQYMPLLMRNKKAPLHAVEVGLYKASLAAKDHGISKLILGNGADSTFGGMDKLLSRDWTFNEFVERYSFINPLNVLISPKSVMDIYEQYRIGESDIDYISFLKYTHGLGIIQAFDNAIGCAGCHSIEPFEQLKLGIPLDIKRIRNSEPKYLLYEIFDERYPGLERVPKVPFARPMTQWLKNWNGPIRPEFKSGCIESMTGDQKFLAYSLELFMNLMEGKDD